MTQGEGTETPVVLLREAVFGYQGHPAVGPVTLQIPAGQSVALTGPNGSGKSTLVAGLLGLNDHLAGKAEIWGESVARLRDRSTVGFVPQHHSVASSLHATVAEVITAGRLPRLPWWRSPGAADRRAVRAAAGQVGLSDRLSENIATLSGGQRRRVLIARAIVSSPELLILDEPTAGVDQASQVVLADLLHDLSAGGMTMLTITHELDALAGALDRVVSLSDGSLSGDHTMTPGQDAAMTPGVTRA